MASETLTIRIRTDGTAEVSRNIAAIGTSARSANNATRLLWTSLRLVSLTIIAKQVIEFADAFTNVQNRLKLVTAGTEELNAVMTQLFAISNDTRSSFEANAQLYNRLRLATKNLGLSQQETLNITRTLNEAVAAAGLRSQEATNGIIQLTQSLASGKLNGDEFRSVMEQLPPVADIIARELGVTRGELYKLRTEGKITSEVIIKALQDYANEVHEKFLKLTPTLSQALTVVRNQVIGLIGEFNTWINGNHLLASSILWVAENLKNIVRVAAPVATALLSALAPVALIFGLTRVIGLVGKLWVLLLSNPFTALLAIIGAVVGYVLAFGDSVQMGSGYLSNLMDVAGVVWEDIQAGLAVLVEFMSKTFGGFFTWLKGLFGEHKFSMEEIIRFAAQVTDSVIATFKGMWAALQVLWKANSSELAGAFMDGLNAMIDYAEKSLNFWIGGFLRLIPEFSDIIKTLGNLWGALGKVIGDIFASEFEVVKKLAIDAFNWIVDQFNRIPGFNIQRIITDPIATGVDALTGLGKALQDIQDKAKKGEQIIFLPRLINTNADAAAKLGEDMKAAFKKAFIESGTPVEDYLDDVLKRADVKAKDRMTKAIREVPPNLTTPGVNTQTTTTTPLTAKELSTLADQLNTLRSGLDDTVLADQGAVASLQKAQADQLKTVKSGLEQRIITEKQAADIIVGIYDTTNRKIRDIEFARYDVQLTAAQSTAESLANIAKGFAGEQSGIYKAMFAASKAFAIADSIIKIEQGVANALSLPFPANLGAVAVVAAEAANIVSNIQAVSASFAKGGLVSGPGNGTSDSINAHLSNGEFVVNAAATRAFLPLLQNMNSGSHLRNDYSSGARSNTIVQVNDQRGSGAPVDVHSFKQAGMETIRLTIRDEIQARESATAYSRQREIVQTVRTNRSRGNL